MALIEKKSLGHLLHRPPPPSCLISFHHLSSNYRVVHLILSADGEGVYGFREGGERFCYTRHAAYCKNIRWAEKYEIGCVVTQLRISDFGRLYAISLTCLVIYPSFHLCRLPGVATRDKTGDRSIGQRLTWNCKLATEALLLDVQASNVKPILFY